MKPDLVGYLAGRKPTQVGIIVPDLKNAIDAWTPLVGQTKEDWSIYTYSPRNVEGMLQDGTFRLAMTGSGPQIELIQHIEGDTIYSRWTHQKGFGIHHLGFHIEDINFVIDLFSRNGYEPIHQGFRYGKNGDGGFAYYDLPELSETLIEFIETPMERRPTETLV